jgi:hypothetical protein
VITLPQSLTSLTVRELIVELDHIEQTIRSTPTFNGGAGEPYSPPRISNELMHLAEREQQIVAELARRRTT